MFLQGLVQGRPHDGQGQGKRRADLAEIKLQQQREQREQHRTTNKTKQRKLTKYNLTNKQNLVKKKKKYDVLTKKETLKNNSFLGNQRC